MIKRTFYNLPEEKRRRITNAILNEFASSSGERVSINSIIKTAKISRGSFYQYFDDKVDLVEVLIHTFLDFTLEKSTETISAAQGDVFVTYKLLFDELCKCADDPKQSVVLKNVLKNIKANDSLISEYLLNRFNGFADLIKVSNDFDRSGLRYSSDEDVEALLQILMQVLKNALFNVFVIGKPADDIRQDYRRKLDIIKNGAVCEDS